MNQVNNTFFFDEDNIPSEQLPRTFQMSFKEVGVGQKNEVIVVLNNTKRIGDIINDNSYENDFYRYHDIFHYSFAALLGWSPCTRAMMRRKRKSNPQVDEIEDGARAKITEEAISMIVYNEAKGKNFFKNKNKVSKTTLKIIKGMTENFEVRVRTAKEWENAILKAYKAFRFLIANKGGIIEFDSIHKELKYYPF
ncbi:nucleotide pyrophosphohydrolase [Zunongwangia pacifica]|uniref:Nucleotide pyrophosphohydrolase n=1 Tax=Zunongwangia pacifica TaxID=2911062 RepID=A0A9X1ZYT0_9FLAO|nr:nucleotide pyrophosphohydrolase [Zunongwangia pacifica]MCL6216919.1 nucleotide pyrophosphohydrolase [Zunongwangia pacifica]